MDPAMVGDKRNLQAYERRPLIEIKTSSSTRRLGAGAGAGPPSLRLRRTPKKEKETGHKGLMTT